MLPQGVSSSGADADILGSISENVDIIVSLSASDVELRNYALKFQLEQAADKAVFDAAGKNVNRLEHMRKVLLRMIDLALAVASHILERTQSHSHVRGPRSASDSLNGASQGPPTGSEMFHSSSVADFAEGTEMWLESGAHLSHASVEVLAMTLIAHAALRASLQQHMLEQGVVSYVADALSVSRDHELSYFQEGYKTEHMRLLANLTFENASAGKAVAHNEHLLREVLSGTKVDEENPGMVEWAEFAIRNMCFTSKETRDRIHNLTPMGISQEAKAALQGKFDCSFTPDGKLHFTDSSPK